MERPPVFTLEVLADRSLLKDVVKGKSHSLNAIPSLPTAKPIPSTLTGANLGFL